MSEADYGAPITEKVGGQDVPFPRLLMKDYAVLESQVRANYKAIVRATLDECKISGKDRYEELLRVDGTEVTMDNVRAYVRTSGGVRKCFELSLAKAGKTAEEIDKIFAAFDVSDAANLAESLVGLSFRVAFDKEVDKRPLSPRAVETPTSNTPSSDGSTASTPAN
jgi:hypothetical protein